MFLFPDRRNNSASLRSNLDIVDLIDPESLNSLVNLFSGWTPVHCPFGSGSDFSWEPMTSMSECIFREQGQDWQNDSHIWLRFLLWLKNYLTIIRRRNNPLNEVEGIIPQYLLSLRRIIVLV